ncbi:putative transposase [Thermodesulfitimonas autotrophica]|uniref:Putative transposase n=1 Tax=Thermodesulfitimonas autotrophica TaxID=1894989 RepID=A0A3N5AX51_9THEO|nr:RNA-guided endonuclease TnpB family protein [Thermodesulfitimonas autotrophica]RPF49574.1 putative transposase [Thermodesulfitimonas autotrophica]
MKRTNVIRVLYAREQAEYLEILADRCAALWNAVQYRCRQLFLKGEPVPSYAKLCSEFKECSAYKALPSDIGQEIIKKARKAWDSFFALLRLYRKGELENRPRLPGYWKDRKTGKRTAKVIPVKSPKSYRLTARTLSLTLPADLRTKNGHRLVLQTRGVLRFSGTPKTLELKCDQVKKRWYARQVVEVSKSVRSLKPEKHAAADLGARILVALAVEGMDQQLLFSGREVWKDFLYWTKRIAEEQSRLNRSGRRTSRRLRQLYRMRALRLKHALAALAARVARTLKRHRVTVLHVEDLTHVRDEMDFGPKNLLVHNFWAFRMVRNLITQACERAGIRVAADGTRDSLTCAVCGSRVRRFARHKALCRHCGRTWHADANAAAYMLKVSGSSKGHGPEAGPGKPLRYRWNKHRWQSRAESAASRSGPKAAQAA